MKRLILAFAFLLTVYIMSGDGLSAKSLKINYDEDISNSHKTNFSMPSTWKYSFDNYSHFIFPIELKIEKIKEQAYFSEKNMVALPQHKKIFTIIKDGVLYPESLKMWGTEYILLAIGVIGYFVVRRRYSI
jgi:hypothetical protein